MYLSDREATGVLMRTLVTLEKLAKRNAISGEHAFAVAIAEAKHHSAWPEEEEAPKPALEVPATPPTPVPVLNAGNAF